MRTDSQKRLDSAWRDLIAWAKRRRAGGLNTSDALEYTMSSSSEENSNDGKPGQ